MWEWLSPSTWEFTFRVATICAARSIWISRGCRGFMSAWIGYWLTDDAQRAAGVRIAEASAVASQAQRDVAIANNAAARASERAAAAEERTARLNIEFDAGGRPAQRQVPRRTWRLAPSQVWRLRPNVPQEAATRIDLHSRSSGRSSTRRPSQFTTCSCRGSPPFQVRVRPLRTSSLHFVSKKGMVIIHYSSAFADTGRAFQLDKQAEPETFRTW